MPPVFDYEKCNGCGKCDALCPADAIYSRFFLSEIKVADKKEMKRPYMKYSEECWHCGSCRQDCPKDAITIVFPPDMLCI